MSLELFDATPPRRAHGCVQAPSGTPLGGCGSPCCDWIEPHMHIMAPCCAPGARPNPMGGLGTPTAQDYGTAFGNDLALVGAAALGVGYLLWRASRSSR